MATTLLGECIWLALGMVLAVLSIHADRSASPPRAVRLVTEHPGLSWIAAIACLIGATVVLKPGGLFNILVSLQTKQPYARTIAGIILTAGLSVFLIAPAVFGEHAGGIPRRILAWAPLAWLGLVSYSVYLYHIVVADCSARARTRRTSQRAGSASPRSTT